MFRKVYLLEFLHTYKDVTNYIAKCYKNQDSQTFPQRGFATIWLMQKGIHFKSEDNEILSRDSGWESAYIS